MKEQEVKVKFKFCEKNIDQEKNITYSFSENTTFSDLKKYLNVKEGAFVVETISKVEGQKYYMPIFDYIHTKDEILWNIKIEDVKISDYLETFETKEICVENVIGEMGDISFGLTLEQTMEAFKFLWENRNVIIDIFDIWQIQKVIKKYIKKEKKKTGVEIQPENYFNAILVKSNWKIDDFRKKFHYGKKEAIAILKQLGYEYNTSKEIYHITNKKREDVHDNLDTIFRSYTNIILSKSNK